MGELSCAGMYRSIMLVTLCAQVVLAGEADRWWRGNTHTHTELCGHADSSPAAVARWYLEHGYHFLCLSEHDRFIDPADVALPTPRRHDFILLPGEELSKHGAVHMTALNIPARIRSGKGSAVDIIQHGTDRTREAGGVPILNHPNYKWAVDAADIKASERLHLFELYNGHPKVRSFGDATHPSLETVWNDLLDHGMVIYAVSSDDAHIFKRRGPDASNPGRGWIMVRAAELAPDAIATAIERGDFYASSGVILAELSADDERYRVTVDQRASNAAIAADTVMPYRPDDDARPGCRIAFIGPGGETVHAVDGTRASCERDPDRAWLRAKITLTWCDEHGPAQAFAWTQPVFGDGRLDEVAVETVRRGWAERADQ